MHTYTVAYNSVGQWALFVDGAVPKGEDWEVFACGLSWERANDLVSDAPYPLQSAT